jgi:hypothetical protein
MVTLIEKLRPKIELQEWVGRFGGLVRTVERIVPSLDGSKSIRQAFPISCTTNARNCFESNEYLALTPDDSHKSICYFEQLGNAQVETSNLQGCTRYVTDYRFVAWLNLPKLGIYEDCNTANEQLMMEVCNLLKCSYLGISQEVSGLLSIEPIEISSQNENIFANYSYSDRQNLLLPPYSFFAITFKFTFDTEGSCQSKFIPMPPISC